MQITIDCYAYSAMGGEDYPVNTYSASSVEELDEIIHNCIKEKAGINEIRLHVGHPLRPVDQDWATVRDMGPGDYIQALDSSWHKIKTIRGMTDHGWCDLSEDGPLPRNWMIETESGRTVDMWGVRKYATAAKFKSEFGECDV